MKKLLFLLLSVSLFSLMQAQVDYVGPNPGTWNNATHWSTGKVPGPGDWVRIRTGDSVEIKKGYHAEIQELEIEAGAGMLIRNGGSLTSNGATVRPGIENKGNLRVFGNLIALNVSLTAAVGIENSAGGSFIIKNKGKVVVEDSEDTGISNSFGGLMANHGLISVHDCASTCFRNAETFINKASGSMDLYDASSNCYSNTGSTENRGSIMCNNAATGIRNTGSFQNSKNGTITIDQSSIYGIFNLSTASFNNEGSVALKQQNSNFSISNSGEVYNHECAYLELDDPIYNFAGASIINSGWLVNTAVSHTNLGTITNYGVIEDDPYSLAWKVTTNLGSMITPIAGPLVENVSVVNPLWVGSYDSLVVVGLYTDAAATISAGTYDNALSSYIPNAAAVGEPILYVKYTNAAGSCGYIFPITITNPNRQGTLHQAAVAIYPNPCKNYLNITLDAAFKGNTTSELLDIQGRVVGSWEMEEEQARLLISPAVKPGIYFLKVSQGVVLLDQLKVVVE